MTGDPLPPILVAHLLRRVDQELLELLRTLSSGDWNRPTVAPGWCVRDVAAHLLDTALRKLTAVRDSCPIEGVVIRSPRDLVEFVNRLNQEGVAVYGRLSPAVLISLLEIACEQSASFHESLDPFAPAAFAVSWAGEESSLNWFDTARELTERWHHQQQIRLATGRPGIMTPELYHPVLDCFLRGLPHLYGEVDAPDGTLVVVDIAGECGGQWFLRKAPGGWELARAAQGTPSARVSIPQDVAWLVFSKGLDQESALRHARIDGDEALAGRVLLLRAIVG